LGDVFFPDNPNRRDRAQQLSGDLQQMQFDFNAIKNDLDTTLANLKPKMNNLLHKLGFNTMEELKAKAQSVLQGEALENYNKLSQSMGDFGTFESYFWITLSAVAVTGAAVSAVVFAFFPPAGAALFGAIETAVAIVATLMIFVDIIQAAVMRDKMREAINKLVPARAQAKQALGRLDAIRTWAKGMYTMLDDLDNMDALAALATRLRENYEQWTPEYTKQILHELDNRRGSWTNEDPSDGSYNLRVMHSIEPKEVKVSCESNGQKFEDKWKLVSQSERNSCVVLSEGKEEILEATAPVDFKNMSQLKLVTFKLTPTDHSPQSDPLKKMFHITSILSLA